MSLAPGTKLGAFEIVELIGVGGMGEVYRARDTKLGREVAIKVLPPDVAGDPDRMARFEREANLLASLAHPNIATLYDFQSDRDVHFLVMELVEGDTLSERLEGGPMPVGEAIPIFVEIARALDAAHERGIVHRDLKPGNIKLTIDDRVKVLDFGLAKSYAADEPSGTRLSSGPDATTLPATPSPPTSITGAEMIVGTPSYMSPEQARGKRVDKRCDVWAFGCCLFEALTGKKVFDGESIADKIGSVTRDEPKWDALPGDASGEIRRLLRGCLEKDPRRRLSSMNDVALTLEETRSPDRDSSEPKVQLIRSPAIAFGAVFLLALGLGFWIRGLRSDEAGTTPGGKFEQPSTKVLTIRLPEEAPIHLPGERQSLAISPDGRYVAYVTKQAERQFLYLVDLSTGEARPVPDTETGKSPFFSPDGRWLGFLTQLEVRKVPIAGGAEAITLSGTPPVSRGAAWSPKGIVAFAPTPASPLSHVRDGQEGAAWLTSLRGGDGGLSHRWPQFIDEGAFLLYTVLTGEDFQKAENARIAIEEVGSGEREFVAEGTRYARYADSGHLIFSRGTALFARPLSLRDAVRDARARGVLDGVMTNEMDGVAQFDISCEGTLVYVSGGARPIANLREIVWVDRSGQETPTGLPVLAYASPTLSPIDGHRIALDVAQLDDQTIWIYDISAEVPTRFLLTPDVGREFDARWSRDGTRIAYSFYRAGAPKIRLRAAAGGGDAEPLYENPNGAAFPSSWSPDDKILAFTLNPFSTAGIQTPEQRSDIWLLPMDGEGDARAWRETPYMELSAKFSPDGKWLAYSSNEE